MADVIAFKFTAKDQFTRVSEKMNKALRKNRKSLRDLDTGMKRSARNTQKSTGRMLKSITKLGKGLAAIAVAGGVIGAGKSVADRSVQIERQVQRLLGNVDVPQRAAFEPVLRQKLLETERKTGGTIEDAGSGLFEFTSTMGTSEKTLQDFDTVVSVSVGSLADLTTTAEGFGKFLKQFPDLDVKELAVSLAAGQQVGSTSVGKLLATAPSVLPTAGKAGLSATDTVALLAATSGRFPSQQEAGTGFTEFFRALTDLKKREDAFGLAVGLGLPAGRAQVNEFIKTQGADALLKLANEIVTDPATADLALDLFGTLPGSNFALISDKVTQTDIGLARAKIAAQIADPAINALVANQKAQTSGPLGVALSTKALVKDTETAIGEAVIDGVTAANEGLGKGGLLDRAGDSFIKARADSAVQGEGSVLQIISGVVEVMKTLGPFDESNPLTRGVAVEVTTGRGLNATVGTPGDTTVAE